MNIINTLFIISNIPTCQIKSTTRKKILICGTITSLSSKIPCSKYNRSIFWTLFLICPITNINTDSWQCGMLFRSCWTMWCCSISICLLSWRPCLKDKWKKKNFFHQYFHTVNGIMFYSYRWLSSLIWSGSFTS